MTFPIYPASFAAMNVSRAGEKYRPSNGTEGDLFMDAFCRRCQRDGAMREGMDFDECDDNERCDLIGRTMLHPIEAPEYPSEWQYGKDGQPCCTAFVPAGQPIPEPRCTLTRELF